MHAAGTVVLCVFAAICYGIAHDQITARVCVEYFTVGHPPVFPTNDPTLLALGWGILATWWVGMILGVALAIAARAGSRPKHSVGSLIKPVATLMLVSAVVAAVAGITGWLLALGGAVKLIGPMAETLPPDRHAVFLADLWVHTASYGVGFIGGVVTVIRVWRSRRVTRTASSVP